LGVSQISVCISLPAVSLAAVYAAMPRILGLSEKGTHWQSNFYGIVKAEQKS
jgi:hypothetical protein